MIHKDILVATVYNSHFYGHILFYCDIEQAYYVTQSFMILLFQIFFFICFWIKHIIFKYDKVPGKRLPRSKNFLTTKIKYRRDLHKSQQF